LSVYKACSATGLKPIAANHTADCAFVTWDRQKGSGFNI
jgi:hypothetical protein